VCDGLPAGQVVLYIVDCIEEVTPRQILSLTEWHVGVT
jgi:hypothetical protein